jgi:hypothetical protein
MVITSRSDSGSKESLIQVTALPPDVRRWLAPPDKLQMTLGYAPGSGAASLQGKSNDSTLLEPDSGQPTPPLQSIAAP